MIHLKINPVGIDIQIQRMQQYLYDKLLASWNCDITAYGRAYLDDKEGSIIPKAYLKKGEYKNVLADDTIKGAHFFFIEANAETVSNSCVSSNNLDLIFIVDDLTKVRSDISHYADEEIKEEVKSYIKSFWEMESISKGKEALDGFDVSKKHFKYPYYVFKISGSINNY